MRFKVHDFFEIESRARVENKADSNVLRDISENNPRQTERERNSVSSKGI